jgi:hypothetical protein
MTENKSADTQSVVTGVAWLAPSAANGAKWVAQAALTSSLHSDALGFFSVGES